MLHRHLVKQDTTSLQFLIDILDVDLMTSFSDSSMKDAISVTLERKIFAVKPKITALRAE